MLWWLIQNALVTAILAGVVAGLCRCLRLSPAVRHALWLLVLVKLLTPPLVSWPWPPPALGTYLRAEPASRGGGRTGEDVTVEPQADNAHPARRPARTSPDRPRETAVAWESPTSAQDESGPPRLERSRIEETEPALPAETAKPAAPTPSVPAAGGPRPQSDRWTPPVLALWLVGAAAMAAFQGAKVLRFRSRLPGGQPPPPWLVGELEGLARVLGVRAPNVLVVPGTGSPLLWSLGRPKLLWPDALLQQLPDTARRGVLVHELAHLRRRDHWVGWLQLLGLCAWWWNPVYWCVRRQLRENAELACDAWVLWALPEARRAYAQALIDVCEMVSRKAPPVAALGMGGGRRDFERRLTMIMREQVPCKVPLRGFLGIGLLALIVLPGWSLGQQAGEKTQDIKGSAGLSQDKVQQTKSGQPGDESVALQKTADGQSSSSDHERRLEAVERQLQVLLKEVQALRGKSSSGGRFFGKNATYEFTVPQTAFDFTLTKPAGKASSDAQDSVQMLTLARATYKLPEDKARALATFLREQLPDDLMEIKINGTALTITTTPETQKAIGQLVALMRMSKTRAPSKDKNDFSGNDNGKQN